MSFVTFLIGRFEMFPFTNKIVYVFPFIEKIRGEFCYFRCVKEGYKKGQVLPQNHPICVRIESIAMKLLEALQMESEQEADYIGMLLSASSGYNPGVAPMILKKMQAITEQHGAHLYDLEKRIEFLSQPKVMQEAVSIYEESIKAQETGC